MTSSSRMVHARGDLLVGDRSFSTTRTIAVPCGVEIGSLTPPLRQREGDLVDLGADADVGDRRPARDELGGLDLRARLSWPRPAKSGAPFSCRGDLGGLGLGDLRRALADQIVAHPIAHFGQLGYVRLLLAASP